MIPRRIHRPVAMVILTAALTLFASGCVPTVPERPVTERPVLEVVEPEELPWFADDMDYDFLAEAIQQSLLYYSRVPDDRRFRFGGATFDKFQLVHSLELFRDFIAGRPDSDHLNRFIRERYRVYRSIGRPPDDDVLFTGYYEPLYPGSLVLLPNYSVPVYGPPNDLVTANLGDFADDLANKRIWGRVEGRRIVPYYTRREIQTQNVLQGKAPIIAWMKDPVDLYFIQVQGSGRIQTPDGRRISILYADQNGRTPDLVGRHLIRENKVPLEEMSMQRIRRYFQEHPEDVTPMLQQDPSFVFFRIGDTGPLGNLGVEVTPARSIATDRRLFPNGALAFIDTRKPLITGQREIGQWAPLKRFVLNQDTGGAIKGPGRADLFWGSGEYAETAAGHLKHPGNLYFLVLKPEAAPTPP